MLITNEPERISGRNEIVSRGAMSVSAGLYLGIAAIVGTLVVSTVFMTTRPLVDQHANPHPAASLPAEVLGAPGSHLYHASASCPYAHPGSKPLAASQAIDRGLVPCPYCIGNSSARLALTRNSQPMH